MSDVLDGHATLPGDGPAFATWQVEVRGPWGCIRTAAAVDIPTVEGRQTVQGVPGVKKSRKLSVMAALTIASVLLLPTAAAAHDPIFITDDQTTPDTGPYMPDGTISWALYGTVLEPGDTRGFEFDLRDGDELYISLLIPNLEPELSLADDQLPTVELETPSGEVMSIVPELREIFDEPFSRTSYVTLAEMREPGEAGRYRGVVIGNAPSRFTVAIGEREIFFTDTERSGNRPTSFPAIAAPLNAWYSTPPGGEPAEDAEGQAEIQLDMIDEAMESGVASVEGSADGEESAGEIGETPAEDGSGLAGVALPAVAAAAAAAGFLVYRRRRNEVDPTDQTGAV
ncbi:MAG: hypothetical protein OER95_05095 [Acidimicrobiia bacterium]|nr:hypothetical protein [Acidimicrobiia bacterium]